MTNCLFLVGGASVPDVLESVMDVPGVAASTNNDALDVTDSGPNMTSVASSVNDMFMSSPGRAVWFYVLIWPQFDLVHKDT